MSSGKSRIFKIFHLSNVAYVNCRIYQMSQKLLYLKKIPKFLKLYLHSIYEETHNFEDNFFAAMSKCHICLKCQLSHLLNVLQNIKFTKQILNF